MKMGKKIEGLAREFCLDPRFREEDVTAGWIPSFDKLRTKGARKT
jgi:hypothetical protein